MHKVGDGNCRIVPKSASWSKAMEIGSSQINQNSTYSHVWDYLNVNNQKWYFDKGKVWTNSNANVNSTYNGKAAATWAATHAITYNAGYLMEDTPGFAWAVSNCVNFASASMYYKGGMSQITGSQTSTSSWYYATKILGTSRNNSSDTWLLSESFAQHFGHNANNQRGYRTIVYPSMQSVLDDWTTVFENLHPGDIIQFTDGPSSDEPLKAFHTGIVIIREASTNPPSIVYAQHSANQPDYTVYELRARLQTLKNAGRDYGIILHRIKRES